MHNVMYVSKDHIIPQSVHQARNLPDSHQWLAAEEDEIEYIPHNEMIAHTSTHLHDGVSAIAAMFIHALKWNHSRYIHGEVGCTWVYGDIECTFPSRCHACSGCLWPLPPGVDIVGGEAKNHFSSSCMWRQSSSTPLSITMCGYDSQPVLCIPLAVSLSNWVTPEVATDWYELQYHPLMAFDYARVRSKLSPCFYYRVHDGKFFFVPVHMDDYYVSFSDQLYFDAWLAHFRCVPNTDEYLDIKLIGDMARLLPIRITRSHNMVWLDKERKIGVLATEYDVVNCKHILNTISAHFDLAKFAHTHATSIPFM